MFSETYVTKFCSKRNTHCGLRTGTNSLSCTIRKRSAGTANNLLQTCTCTCTCTSIFRRTRYSSGSCRTSAPLRVLLAASLSRLLLLLLTTSTILLLEPILPLASFFSLSSGLELRSVISVIWAEVCRKRTMKNSTEVLWKTSLMMTRNRRSWDWRRKSRYGVCTSTLNCSCIYPIPKSITPVVGRGGAKLRGALPQAARNILAHYRNLRTGISPPLPFVFFFFFLEFHCRRTIARKARWRSA